MGNQTVSQSQHNDSPQMHENDAQAILFLMSSQPDSWRRLMEYLQRRLGSLHIDMESIPTDTAPGLISRAQGQCEELRHMIGIETRARDILESRPRQS